MDETTFQFLDPETQQLMIQAGLAPQRAALAGQQGQRGAAMADTQTPQGQTVGPYHAFVASSPLEHLASGLRIGRGEMAMRDARQEQQNQLGLLGKGRGAYLAAAVRQAQNENRQPPLPDQSAIQAPQPIGPDESIPYYLRRPGY